MGQGHVISRLVPLFLTGLLVPHLSQAVEGVKAHTFDDVFRVIRAAEGKSAFVRHMDGTADLRGLGTSLPAGFTRDAIIASLVPSSDASTALQQEFIVGSVAWKQKSDHFIAIACVPAGETSTQQPCGSRFYLGTFRKGPADLHPTLVAHSKESVRLAADWSKLGTDAPIQPIEDQEVVRFDLAPYRIAPNEIAFGLRTAQAEGYAGGFGYFETLRLFRIIGSEIREILSHPIYVLRDTAGNWNRDQTRQHIITEKRFTLSIAPTQTAGFFNLHLQEENGARRFEKKWNPQTSRYE